MKTVRLIVALTLGLLFLYSGAVKASKSDEFAMNIARYLILSPWCWKPAAIVISLLEFGAGTLLLIPHTRHWGASLVLLLMGMFLYALGTALLRGLVISCGCLPGQNEGSPLALWFALWKDVAISLGAAFLLMPIKKKTS